MLGGLIGTALGTIGGNFLEKGIGSIFGKSTADQNYEYERRLQKHDQEFQKEMRATAYQTAVQDMQKAGINPAVALSSGGGDTYGGSSSHGSVAMQTPTSGTMAETMSSIINTALTKAQKENIEADTELKNKQSGKTEEEQKAIRTNTRIQEETNKIQQAIMNGNLTKQQYEIMINEATSRLLEEEIGIKEAEKKTAVNNRRWHEIRDSITAFIPFVSGSAAWRSKGGGITINNN